MKLIKSFSSLFIFSLIYLAAFTLSLSPLLTYALSTSAKDNQQPVKITSNQFWANNIKGIAIYSGDVIADQGSRHLTGNELTLYRDTKGQINKIIAKGEPAKFSYRPKSKLMTAEAEIITVYPQKHMINLAGKAKLTQAGDTFSAPQIFYNTETQILTTPESKQSRSHMVIEPKQITTPTQKAKP